MERLKEAARAPVRVLMGFGRGFGYPFRGFAFVYFKHPGLIGYWIPPVFLTLVSLVLVGWAAIAMPGDWLEFMRPTGDDFWAGVGRFFHGALVVLASILLFIGGFFLVAAIANVLAAPFKDKLSEKVEERATQQPGPDFSFSILLRDTGRSLLLETVKFTLYLLIVGPLFIASLFLPVIGQILYTVVASFVTITYFAIDYIDWPASRRNYGLGMRAAFFRRHLLAMLGFGAGVWLFLFIPLLNLLFMPAAVAGGTLLFLELERLENLEKENPDALESLVGKTV